jgi:hypothetical protein
VGQKEGQVGGNINQLGAHFLHNPRKKEKEKEGAGIVGIFLSFFKFYLIGDE